MSENHLGTQGLELLREVLKQNNSLTHLTLQGNDFNDSTAPIWADIISVCSIMIIILILKHLKHSGFLLIKIEYNKN